MSADDDKMLSLWPAVAAALDEHRERNPEPPTSVRWDQSRPMSRAEIEHYIREMMKPTPPRGVVVSMQSAALFVKHGVSGYDFGFASHRRHRFAHRLAQALHVGKACDVRVCQRFARGSRS